MNSRRGVGRQSAGIFLFRKRGARWEVLLVHPGGPFWKAKDENAWSIPKGEAAPGEDLLARARLEFAEEIGSPIDGDFIPLTPIRQAGGKMVHAWAVEGDLDIATLHSNTFEMEWPPKSGKRQSFPEVDRAEWFSLSAALPKINKAQAALLDELERKLAS